MFMISWSTNSEAAEVLTLNPARFSSSPMVAVPPEDDDVAAALLVAGATATIDIPRAAAAIAVTADLLRDSFTSTALLLVPTSRWRATTSGSLFSISAQWRCS